jgi:hypothetical protein
MLKVTVRTDSISTWDIAKRTNRAPKTIWLDAKAGKIPGMKLDEFGQASFRISPELREYIKGRKKTDQKGRRKLPPMDEVWWRISLLKRFLQKHDWDQEDKQEIEEWLIDARNVLI